MTPASAELAPSSCTPLPLRSRHTKSPIRIGAAKPKSNVRLCDAGATLAPRIVTNVPLTRVAVEIVGHLVGERHVQAGPLVGLDRVERVRLQAVLAAIEQCRCRPRWWWSRHERAGRLQAQAHLGAGDRRLAADAADVVLAAVAVHVDPQQVADRLEQHLARARLRRHRARRKPLLGALVYVALPTAQRSTPAGSRGTWRCTSPSPARSGRRAR
jgi:hypothetical protein